MLICPSSRLLDASMKRTQNTATITSKAFQITNRNRQEFRISASPSLLHQVELQLCVFCACVYVCRSISSYQRANLFPSAFPEFPYFALGETPYQSADRPAEERTT